MDESRPLTPAELTELSRLLVRVVAASEALLDYATQVAGKALPEERRRATDVPGASVWVARSGRRTDHAWLVRGGPSRHV